MGKERRIIDGPLIGTHASLCIALNLQLQHSLNDRPTAMPSQYKCHHSRLSLPLPFRQMLRETERGQTKLLATGTGVVLPHIEKLDDSADIQRQTRSAVPLPKGTKQWVGNTSYMWHIEKHPHPCDSKSEKKVKVSVC